MSHTPDQPEADSRIVSEAATGDNTRASWNFSLHQVRANIAHCSPEGKEALVAAFLWCNDARHPIHRNEFSRRVGYSANTIWKIYNGKYRSPAGDQMEVPRELIKAIRHFLDLEKERYGSGNRGFVPTPTARRIFQICDLARESQTPAFIWGHSHCGKSWAGEAYVSSNNHGRSVYCRIKAASGLGGLVRRLAGAVGISDSSNTANLVDYIKRAITKDMLIFFDEVHLLSNTYRRSSFFACLEVIREIYDETQCGMVLCGTRLLIDHISGNRHAELEQLFNRGTHQLNLMSSPTRADIVALLVPWGLTLPDRHAVVTVVPASGKKPAVEDSPYEVLRQLSTTVRLKAISERLRYGKKIAAKAGVEQMTWEHFLQAHHIITAQAAAEGNGWE